MDGSDPVLGEAVGWVLPVDIERKRMLKIVDGGAWG